VLFPKDAGYDVRLAGAEVKVMRRGDQIALIHDGVAARRLTRA
jgi:hypothetical protein